ncbi:MAG: DUF2341 domain-containing protein [Lewinella sp.]|jgi:hypothetical protein|uniref:DUF2341 domain-containing protein n=1 Tax=Lewinella sp. TaxID=2004506 RepID=UPI003D6C6A3D
MKYFTLLLFSFSCYFLQAQDCAAGWAYYQTVSIDNSLGGNLTDYQVAIELNTAALVADGKMRTDGADLRVYTTDCTLLPFWGDSLGLNTATKVWVKIPSIAAGASMEVQVYYGKADATSAADGDNTFIFFDDFSSGTVDPAKWETVGEFATLEVINGSLNYSSTGNSQASRFKFARTVPVFSEEVIFDYVGAVSNSNGFGFSSNANTEIERILFRQGAAGFDTLGQVAVMMDTLDNGYQSEVYPLLRFDRNLFNTASITVGINEDDYLQVNRFANVGLGTENVTPLIVNQIEGMTGFHFIMSTFSFTPAIYLNNIRVRQHTATPPVSSNGAEIFLDPSSLTSLIDPSRVQVFPNPTTEQSQISIDYQEPVSVQVFNAQGQQLNNLSIRLNPGESAPLTTSQLPAGLYLLQFNRSSDGALLHAHSLSVIK